MDPCLVEHPTREFLAPRQVLIGDHSSAQLPAALAAWGVQTGRAFVVCDPVVAQKVEPLLDFLYRTYFRVDVRGVGHIPDEGRGLIVSNHSGGVAPYDGAMIMRRLDRLSRRVSTFATAPFFRSTDASQPESLITDPRNWLRLGL